VERRPSDERRIRSDLRTASRDRGLAVYLAALTVVVATLLVGSGPPWAQWVSATLAFAVAVFFAATRKLAVRAIPFALPAAVAVAMTAFQLLPLPARLVRLLSPQAHDLRVDVAGTVPALLPLTVDVPATLLELGKGLACLALLLVIGTAARRSSRARPLILTLAFVGALIAVIHVVQRVFGIQGILGLYRVQDFPGTGLWGTFVNGNQAASLLALSALVAAGLVLESTGPLRAAAMASALLSFGVLVTTTSRAGFLGLAAGILAFSGLMFSRRFGSSRGVPAAFALVLVLGAGAVASSSAMRTRLMRSTPLTPHQDQKVRGWKDTARLIAAYPWTGVGRGAFEAPATVYREDLEGVRLVFPENLALQISSEWGLPTALFLLGLFALAARRVVPAIPELEPSVQAAACGVFAVLVHEMADFGLELPGVAFPTVAALGLVLARIEHLQDPARKEGRRLGPAWVIPGLALWAAALAAGLWAIPRTLSIESRQLKEAVARQTATPERLSAAILRHPADYYLELLAATDAIRRRDPMAGRHLNRAQQLNPAEPAVHLMTARWLATLARRSQAALEYRLAAERGWSPGYQEVAAAVGDLHLAEGVAQKEGPLMEVAGMLLRHGSLQRAIEVSRRATVAGNGAELPYVQRLELARESKSTAFIDEAARSLLGVASDPASFIAAASALSALGQHPAADSAIEKGLLANPRNSRLVIAGARFKLDRDDLTGATMLLVRGREAVYTLEDRMQMEELRAIIAEKRGDPGGAATIRARARAMAKMSLPTE